MIKNVSIPKSIKQPRRRFPESRGTFRAISLTLMGSFQKLEDEVGIARREVVVGCWWLGWTSWLGFSGSFSVAPIQAEPSAARWAVAAVAVDARAPPVAAAQATVATAVATAVAATIATAVAAAIAIAQAAVAAATVGAAHAVVAVAQACVVAHGLRREGLMDEQGEGVLSLSIPMDHGPFIRASVVGGTHCRIVYDLFPTNFLKCTSRILALLDDGRPA